MPVKKRVPKSRPYRITSEVVEVFGRCLEMERSGCDEFFEEDGGRRHEYLDARSALNRSLGVRPWEVSPLDVRPGPAPDFGPRNAWHDSWPVAQTMRAELMRALRKAQRGAR